MWRQAPCCAVQSLRPGLASTFYMVLPAHVLRKCALVCMLGQMASQNIMLNGLEARRSLPIITCPILGTAWFVKAARSCFPPCNATGCEHLLLLLTLMCTGFQQM